MATQTAAERRARAKLSYDAFLASCPSRQLLDALTDKWVCLVLSALEEGPLRHSELARRIAGVSQKMLTQTLRSLERDGMITRAVTASVPVRVDYALTDLGRSLTGLVTQIKYWAEDHMPDVLEARERHRELETAQR